MRVWVLMVSWGMVLRSKVGERGGELGVIVDVISRAVPGLRGLGSGCTKAAGEDELVFLYGGSADGARACALSVVTEMSV